MEILGFISAALMGVVLGIIGGGGSILTVPILVYFFGFNPVMATGSSLFVVGTTALVGAMSYLKSGRVRVKKSLFFAGPSIVGVLVARQLLLPLLPQTLFAMGGFEVTKNILLMLLFAVLMLLASVKMLRGNSKPRLGSEPVPQHLKNFSLASRGFFVGLVTGFIGAGGGFLIVPALIVLLGLTMSEAVGTSLMIIAANSLVGFLGSLGSTENYPWSILILMVVLAIAGLLLGTRMQGRFSEPQLKKGFGAFVLVVGSLILLDQISKM